MSAWINENCISFFQYSCIKILKFGRIPRHLALIMDGNRRYARKFNIETCEGHHKGFDTLSKALKWCLELGISVVTVYAFSIENFKRTKNEVDSLMELSREKFKSFLDDIDHMNELGIRLNAVGRLSLLPNDLSILILKAMLRTRNNNKLLLNIAYAYTGRDDISRAASCIIDCVKNNELPINEVNEDLISQTVDLGEPDLLIRTSGEVRLSDFMLWQVSNSVLYFTDVYWPELSIWNILAAIIHFRRYAPTVIIKKDISVVQENFLKNLEKKKWQEIEKSVFQSLTIL